MARLSTAAMLTLGLCTCVAADVPGFLDWLKQHGEEAFETAQQCSAAVKELSAMQKHCKTAEGKGMQSFTAFATWGLIEALEHSKDSFARELASTAVAKELKAGATTFLEQTSHNELEFMCSTEGCTGALDKYMASYTNCYTPPFCLAMSRTSVNVTYEDCKPIMTRYLSMQMKERRASVCEKETAADYYCTELPAEMLFQDPTCYIQISSNVPLAAGHEDCPAQCNTMLSKAETSHPECSSSFKKTIETQGELAIRFLRELYSHSRNPEVRKLVDHLPEHRLPTYWDTCRQLPAMSPPMTI